MPNWKLVEVKTVRTCGDETGTALPSGEQLLQKGVQNLVPQKKKEDRRGTATTWTAMTNGKLQPEPICISDWAPHTSCATFAQRTADASGWELFFLLIRLDTGNYAGGNFTLLTQGFPSFGSFETNLFACVGLFLGTCVAAGSS